MEPHSPGMLGWTYGPFDSIDDGNQRLIALIHQTGYRTSFQIPEFVSQGEEIGQIARIVIGAWERREALKGVGG
jgi:hypothetical protein